MSQPEDFIDHVLSYLNVQKRRVLFLVTCLEIFQLFDTFPTKSIMFSDLRRGVNYCRQRKHPKAMLHKIYQITLE